jgi:hypothetical protein
MSPEGGGKLFHGFDSGTHDLLTPEIKVHASPGRGCSSATRLLWVGKERTVEAFQGFFTMLGEELTSKNPVRLLRLLGLGIRFRLKYKTFQNGCPVDAALGRVPDSFPQSRAAKH